MWVSPILKHWWDYLKLSHLLSLFVDFPFDSNLCQCHLKYVIKIVRQKCVSVRMYVWYTMMLPADMVRSPCFQMTRFSPSASTSQDSSTSRSWLRWLRSRLRKFRRLRSRLIMMRRLRIWLTKLRIMRSRLRRLRRMRIRLRRLRRLRRRLRRLRRMRSRWRRLGSMRSRLKNLRKRFLRKRVATPLRPFFHIFFFRWGKKHLCLLVVLGDALDDWPPERHTVHSPSY